MKNEIAEKQTNVAAKQSLAFSVLAPFLIFLTIKHGVNSPSDSYGYGVLFFALAPIAFNIYSLTKKQKRYKYFAIIGLVINISVVLGAWLLLAMLASIQ